MPEQVDYDALASKHGGMPDYDALAAQHGATASASASPSQIQVMNRSAVAPAAALTVDAAPWVAKAAAAFATSPTAAKVGSSLANSGTTVAGIIHGAMSGNVPEIIASPLAGWQAGKGGYWLTKGLQKAAAPVAEALDTVAPYAAKVAPYLNMLGTAQAEGAALQRFNTPAVRAELAKAMVDKLGITPSEAIKRVTNDAKDYGNVMSAYMQARQVK